MLLDINVKDSTKFFITMDESIPMEVFEGPGEINDLRELQFSTEAIRLAF